MKEEKEVRKAFAGISAKRKKNTLSCVAAFLASIALAACSLFPGMYPIGAAVVSATSTAALTLSAYLGALVGCALVPDMGGACAAAVTLTLVLRALLSAYLGSDSLYDLIHKAGKPKPDVNPPDMTDNGGKDGTALRAEGLLFRESIKVRVLLSSAAALFLGAWSVAAGGFGYYDLFGAVFSALCAPGITFLLYTAFDKHTRASALREIGVCAASALLSLALHRLNDGGVITFDLGAAFSFALVSLAASKLGLYRAIELSVFCGAAVSPNLIPALALSALLQSALEKYSLTLAALSSVSAASAYSVLVGGLTGFVSTFPPAVISLAATMPLIKGKLNPIPKELFGSEISASHEKSKTERALTAERECRARVRALSDSFLGSSCVMNGVADRLRKPGPDELGEIVSDTFTRYCGLCRNREKCASRVGETQRAMSRALSDKGELSAALVPPALASSCHSIGRIIDEINSAFTLRVSGMREGDFLGVAAEDMASLGELLGRLDSSLDEEFGENRALSRALSSAFSKGCVAAAEVHVLGTRKKRVYADGINLSSTRAGADDIRKIIENTLGGTFTSPTFSIDGELISMRSESAKSLSVLFGSYSVAASRVHMYCKDKNDKSDIIAGADCGEKRVEISDEQEGEVSGDGIICFECGGRQYMILSDGMGSGKEASVASGMALSLLKKYIEGGAELESALRLLNRILRSAGRECSATIDICEIDLYTSTARFIKSGAAPSFVLRDGAVFRLQSKTVPIGIIRALDAEMIKFDVEAGDTVVMLSDGCAKSYEDAPWLLDMMTSDELVLRGDETTASMAIVSEAALRGSTDDITCGIMRIK